jgi:hypothetical protein
MFYEFINILDVFFLIFWKNDHRYIIFISIFVHNTILKPIFGHSYYCITSSMSCLLDKIELTTSWSLLLFTSIHFEALMLALFNKLRGLWRFGPVDISISLFSLFSFLEVWTRSLQKVKLQYLVHDSNKRKCFRGMLLTSSVNPWK